MHFLFNANDKSNILTAKKKWNLILLLKKTYFSVVIGVRPVTQRSLVQTPLWSHDIVCFVPRQVTLSTLSMSQSTQLNVGTGFSWYIVANLLWTVVLSRGN